MVLYFHIGWLHTHYFTDLQNQKLGKHHLMLRSTSGAEGRGVVRGTLGITRVDGNIGEILSINGTGVS